MVNRRAVFAFLWVVLPLAWAADGSLFAQQDQKNTGFYVNAAPSEPVATRNEQPTASATQSPGLTVAQQTQAPAQQPPAPAHQTPVIAQPVSPASTTQTPVPAAQTTGVTQNAASQSADSAGDVESRQIHKTEVRRPIAPDNSKENSAKTAVSVWRMILSLAVVLVLIFVGAYFFRRITQAGSPTRADRSVIHILARNMIAPKQYVYLIKMGSRLLVVGVSPNHMTTLDIVDDPDEIARLIGSLEQQHPQSISNGFSKLFQRQTEDYNTDRTESESDVAEPSGSIGDAADDGTTRQWTQAQGEVHSLLDKVKSLTRLNSRSSLR